MLGLTIHAKEIHQQSLEQIRAFLESSQELRFQGQGREEVYAWIARTLREQGYRRQSRALHPLFDVS
jgi:predicted nucleic acid-binding protein